MKEKYQLRVVYLSWLTEQVSALRVKSLTLQYATTLGTHRKRYFQGNFPTNCGRRCHTLAHSENDALTLENACSGTRYQLTYAERLYSCAAALEAITAGTKNLALAHAVATGETRGQCPQG